MSSQPSIFLSLVQFVVVPLLWSPLHLWLFHLYTMSQGDHNIVNHCWPFAVHFANRNNQKYVCLYYTWHCFKLKLVGPCAKVKVQRNETYFLRNATSRKQSFSCLVRAVDWVEFGITEYKSSQWLKEEYFLWIFYRSPARDNGTGPSVYSCSQRLE